MTVEPLSRCIILTHTKGWGGAAHDTNPQNANFELVLIFGFGGVWVQEKTALFDIQARIIISFFATSRSWEEKNRL
jgi:hypothetical protein